MAEYRLFLNDTEVDIISTEVRQSKQVNSLLQFDNRQVNVTDTFTLADNNTTRRLFRDIQIPTSTSAVPNTRISAQLMLDDITVFDGFFRLTKYNHEGRQQGFRGRLVSSIQSIKELLENTLLADALDNTADHVKTFTEVNTRIKQQVSTTPYTYALFTTSIYQDDQGARPIQPSLGNSDDYQMLRITDHRNYTVQDEVEFPELQPVLYTSYVMNRISNLIGKPFIGAVFNTKAYLTQVYNLNKARIMNPRFAFNTATGLPLDASFTQMTISEMVHDIDLWTLFHDFLISFGLIFEETPDSLDFVAVSDVTDRLQDWTDNFAGFIDQDFQTPNFGQQSTFNYRRSPSTVELESNIGTADFETFYDTGFHVEPYTEFTFINNQYLPIQRDIFNSRFENQLYRVYRIPTETNYTDQTAKPYAVVNYGNRLCSRVDGNLFHIDLYQTFIDQEVPISSGSELTLYSDMFDAVHDDNAVNSVVEAVVRDFYNGLEGNAPMNKFRIEALNTTVLFRNVLNTNSGAFPSNPYQTLTGGQAFYNILEPVLISDALENNRAWFDIIGNYKSFRARFNFTVIQFHQAVLTRAVIVDGTIYYVNEISKFVPNRLTEVQLIKIR